MTVIKFRVITKGNGVIVSLIDGNSDKNYLVVPKGTKKISDDEFYFAVGDSIGISPGITVLELPPSLKTIGESSFKHCTGIPALTLPNRLTTIESSILYTARALQNRHEHYAQGHAPTTERELSKIGTSTMPRGMRQPQSESSSKSVRTLCPGACVNHRARALQNRYEHYAQGHAPTAERELSKIGASTMPRGMRSSGTDTASLTRR